MKNNIQYFIPILIISMFITCVMPFNIVYAEQQLNYGKAAITQGNTLITRYDSSGNEAGITATSGNVYAYGYYNESYTPKLRFYSDSIFTISPSSGSVYQGGINNTLYYTNEYTTITGNTSPYYVNSAFPQIADDSPNAPNSGDYVFDFLGPEAFLGTTHYNAEQSFLSWIVGANPYTITCSTDCYVVGFTYSSNNLNSTSYSGYYAYFFVENADATIEITRANGSLSPTLNHTQYRGNDIYYYLIDSWSYNPSSYTVNWNTNIIRAQNNNSLIYANPLHLAYNIYLYDTYEEPDPMVYGDIKDLGYYSKFVNGQQSSSYVQRLTKDVITWNSNVDNIGNRIDNGNYQVQIQAVGVEYSELSYNSLMSLDVNDMLALGEPVDIATVDARNGKIELTWGDIIDALSDQNIVLITSSIFAPVYQNDYWIKQGWYYKVRLINESEEYYGDWQTVYQLTAFDPKPSQNVIDYYINDNNNSPNQDVQQVINNINNINNTVNNWYNGDSPVLPYDSNNDNWLTSLIEGISAILSTILNGIFGVASSLVSGIFDLIKNLIDSALGFFTNIWNQFNDLLQTINFTNDNQEYDLNIPQGESFLDIIPAFIRGMSSAGISYMIWIPLVVGIIFMIL